MDPQAISNADSSLRYLGFLLENQHVMEHEIAELASLKSVFKSLEDSLNSSVYFYKSQLEKADIQNKGLVESLNSIKGSLTNKIKDLTEKLMKSSESECFHKEKIERLSIQLEFERKQKQEISTLFKSSQEKIAEMELANSNSLTHFYLDKQKLLNEHLEEVKILTDTIKAKDKEIEELSKFKAQFDNHICQEEKADQGEIDIFYPIADCENAIKVSQNLLKLQNKFQRLEEENHKLHESISGLLDDIEYKVPLIHHQKLEFEKIAKAYETLKRDYQDCQTKQPLKDENIEKMKKELECTILENKELKSKITLLVKENYTIIRENHKLINKSDANISNFESFQSYIDKYSSIVQVNEKITEEKSALTNKIIASEAEIKKFKNIFENYEKEISLLKIRLGIYEKTQNSNLNFSSSFEKYVSNLELEKKTEELNFCKQKLEESLKESADLRVKLSDYSERYKNLTGKFENLSQELFKAQTKTFTNPFPLQTPQIHNKPIEKHQECVLECEKKTAELLQDKAECVDLISNLQKEIISVKQAWIEEVTRLRSENELLLIQNNFNEYAKVQDELGKSRSSLREFRYLLAISEKELLEEKTKRIHAENNLNFMRGALANIEKEKMETADYTALFKRNEELTKQIEELNRQCKSLKEELEKNTFEYEKSLNIAKQAFVKEKDISDLSQKNLKQVLHAFAEVCNKYEIKAQECASLGSYIEEKLSQSKEFQALLTSNQVDSSGIRYICSMFHKKVDSFLNIQDKETKKICQQIEVLRKKLEEAKLKLQASEKLNQELVEKAKSSEILSKNPEALCKMVSLIYKSSKALRSHC
ncbi:hypothetical protein SteCoe_1842 [Stentor coeruleus]|uniref:Uncharacterized protein n=1 Tax=Stentor coeruleus TaxID=5963 RepID=A0A1R2D0S4_9CILI|nr:hypothetical protein SteCoe_1842 [Stentor coeruleus]